MNSVGILYAILQRRRIVELQNHWQELLGCLEKIITEAIEHWPDAENWECIKKAQDLVNKIKETL